MLWDDDDSSRFVFHTAPHNNKNNDMHEARAVVVISFKFARLSVSVID
jgi:hypothetical protein